MLEKSGGLEESEPYDPETPEDYAISRHILQTKSIGFLPLASTTLHRRHALEECMICRLRFAINTHSKDGGRRVTLLDMTLTPSELVRKKSLAAPACAMYAL